MMQSNKIKFGAKILLLAVTKLVLVSFGVMLLWNWLIPGIFGLGTISIIQALGLLVLSKLLFSGFGKRNHYKMQRNPGRTAHWKEKFQEKMEGMCAEEKDAFKEEFRHKCGGKFMQNANWKKYDQKPKESKPSTADDLF